MLISNRFALLIKSAIGLINAIVTSTILRCLEVLILSVLKIEDHLRIETSSQEFSLCPVGFQKVDAG